MAFLVVEKGSNESLGKTFKISEKPLIIGNPTPESQPDIPIVNDYVSRRHLMISFCGDSFMISDLGSKNGTELNGKIIKCDELYSLSDDSVIGLAVINGEPQIKLRFKMTVGTKGPATKSHYAWTHIDEDKKEVFIHGKQIALTKSEYDLLLLLYNRKGGICTRDDIIAGVSIWSKTKDPGAITNAQIDALIRRLREKIERNPSNPEYIISVRTFGYKFQSRESN